MVKAMIDSNTKEKILTTIENSGKNRGLSLEEIIERTGFSRGTVGKYVVALLGENSVTLDIIGNVKLVCLNKSPHETKGGVS